MSAPSVMPVIAGYTADHLFSRLAFCGATGQSQLRIHGQLVAVLHEHMPHVRQLGCAPSGLLEKARIGIGGGGMRAVLAALTAEVHFRVLTASAWTGSILGLEALHRSPSLQQRLQQRPIHAEVLIGEQPGRLRLVADGLEEAPGHLSVQQPVAVLGERGVIPDRIVHGQPHKPAKEQVIVQLLHQQSFAADRIEHLQHQRRNNCSGAIEGRPV